MEVSSQIFTQLSENAHFGAVRSWPSEDKFHSKFFNLVIRLTTDFVLSIKQKNTILFY